MIKMKHWICILTITLISCNSVQEKVSNSETSFSTPSAELTNAHAQTKNETCWTGNLNGNVPVFLHYQLDGNLVIGEIIYLNTKDKKPIKLLGTIEDNKSYRLLEFDPTGNITGIIIGTPLNNQFNGIWFSPKTKKELAMKLSLLDTIIRSPEITPIDGQIFGSYHYQYGKGGFNGDFEVNKVGDKKIDFSILSLTNVERGSNIAQVEKDTITISGNSFIYKTPDSDSCEFKTTFYKGFVYIKYTKGYCSGQFGLNATIDGIYIKSAL
jgi:hypothetical protein